MIHTDGNFTWFHMLCDDVWESRAWWNDAPIVALIRQTSAIHGSVHGQDNSVVSGSWTPSCQQQFTVSCNCVLRVWGLPLARMSRLLKTSRLFSRLMWIPYGVEPSVLWAATSSRESLDRRERTMGTLRAAAAFGVPISPSAWMSRCIALGAKPKGTAAFLPHNVVLMSMFSTLRRTRGRRRYLLNAVSFQSSLQSIMFRETIHNDWPLFKQKGKKSRTSVRPWRRHCSSLYFSSISFITQTRPSKKIPPW